MVNEPVHAADYREGFPACDITVGPDWISNNKSTGKISEVTCEKCLKVIAEGDSTTDD